MGLTTEQLPAFPERDRFAHAVLGLLALAERIANTLEIGRSDGKSGPDGPLVELILGAVSLRRTLRAALTVDGELAALDASPAETPTPGPTRWLR